MPIMGLLHRKVLLVLYLIQLNSIFIFGRNRMLIICHLIILNLKLLKE